MQIQINGWKKVYFFYGIVFFGLGVLGFFFNNRLSLSRLAQLAFANVSQELSDLGLIPFGESRAVTVFNPRLRSIVLVYPENTGGSLYDGLKERILYREGARTEVISYPVSEREWFKSPQSRWLLNNDRFVIGVNPDSDWNSLKEASILFSLSKPMTAEFVNRLINYQPEIPLFKLELISRGQTFLYSFSLEESQSTSVHLMKVMDILLDLWETGGHSLQRGNYRETLW